MAILSVDSDTTTVRALTKHLRALGHPVDACSSAERALQLTEQRSFAVVVTEWALPGMCGLDLCRELRRRGVRSGLVVLTGRRGAEDRLEAFRARIDDYQHKPFDPLELGARLDALARRVADAQSHLSRAGTIAIDEGRGIAYVGSQAVELTRCEFQLLRELVRAPGQVLSRRYLLERAWGMHHEPSSNLVEVHFHHLRRKLGHARMQLLTVRGRGYALRATHDTDSSLQSGLHDGSAQGV